MVIVIVIVVSRIATLINIVTIIMLYIYIVIETSSAYFPACFSLNDNSHRHNHDVLA